MMGLPIIVGVMFWNHSHLIAGILALAIMFGVAWIVATVSYVYVFKQEKAMYLEMIRNGRMKAVSDVELNKEIKWLLKWHRKDRN
jgi:hypothetical protein